MKELGFSIFIWSLVVFLGALALTFVWGWVIPDVFAGMVQQGMLPDQLSLWQAIKLSILVGMFRGFSKFGNDKE